MKTADEILNMVNEFLENLPYDRKPYSLYEPIKYVLSMGGKRIRPTLMLLGYNIFKNDPEKILMNAIALETYHNYTLLHDDLMDNADLRRGHETVHKKWDANTAILSGDSMLVLAYERMAQCDEKHLAKVLKIFTTTALEIGEGQQYDMEFETRNDVKEEEYIEMIRLKTSVLLACALKIGAVLADASEEAAETPADGEYSVNVTLEGGSGRATVESPAALTVADGTMTAVIVWSSPNYDYMLIDGEKYLPTNTEGNSTFEIPVAALDTALAVTADTVAMSTPHEIDYTLTFDSATLTPAE